MSDVGKIKENLNMYGNNSQSVTPDPTNMLRLRAMENYRKPPHTQEMNARPSQSRTEMGQQPRRWAGEGWQQRDASQEGDRQHTQQEVIFSPDSAKKSVLDLARKIFLSKEINRDNIYKVYSYLSQPERKLTEEEKIQFLQQMKESSVKYKSTVDSSPQISSGVHIATDKFLSQFPMGKNHTNGAEIIFYKADARDVSKKGLESKARLSLRLNPVWAMEVFDYVSSKLVAEHSHVLSAKLTGPSHIHKRTESMVIYLKERDEKIAHDIAQGLNTTFHDPFFSPGSPAGMYEMFSGIGYAEKFHNTEMSHGEMVADAIASAMRKCERHVLQYQQNWQRQMAPEQLSHIFETTFLPTSFQERGIDPESPYKNAS